MTGEQIARIIMACNELGKSRSLLTDLANDGSDTANRIAAILNKLKECEDELTSIQNGK